jgi:cell division septation protein DedD
LTQQVHDDGFHEIQLNGKQLVFLFMAATVVSVVIFLCGVLVGRGVKTERLATSDAVAVNVAAETTPQQPGTPPPPTPAGSDPTAAAPPPAVDDLTYFDRLEKPHAGAEQLKPASARKEAPAPLTAAATPVKPVKTGKTDTVEKTAKADAHPAPAQAPSKPARPINDAKVEAHAVPAPASSTAASTDGYTVQIAALNVRVEADAIAKRLASKGYAAYVLAPAAGTPSMFRVRIGKFPTRREADTMAAKLQKEEQFKPWVTR